jgi:peptidoglycan-N-acetylglucosamine deacetylase
MPSPEQLFSLYQDEFDGAYEQRTLFVLTLHPHVGGHRAPMRQLERLIKYMKAKPDVWFATGEQIALWVKDPAHAK